MESVCYQDPIVQSPGGHYSGAVRKALLMQIAAENTSFFCKQVAHLFSVFLGYWCAILGFSSYRSSGETCMLSQHLDIVGQPATLLFLLISSAVNTLSFLLLEPTRHVDSLEYLHKVSLCSEMLCPCSQYKVIFLGAQT